MWKFEATTPPWLIVFMMTCMLVGFCVILWAFLWFLDQAITFYWPYIIG